MRFFIQRAAGHAKILCVAYEVYSQAAFAAPAAQRAAGLEKNQGILFKCFDYRTNQPGQVLTEI